MYKDTLCQGLGRDVVLDRQVRGAWPQVLHHGKMGLLLIKSVVTCMVVPPWKDVPASFQIVGCTIKFDDLFLR